MTNRAPTTRNNRDSVHAWPPSEQVATLSGYELEDRTLITKWTFSTGEEISRVVFHGTQNWEADLNVLIGAQKQLEADDLDYELEQAIGKKYNVKIRPKVGDSGKNVVNRIRSKVESD